MSRKTDPLKLNQAIAEYLANIPTNEIISKFNITRSVLYRGVKAAGIIAVDRRQQHLNVIAAINMFNSGIGINGIAKALNVSAIVIKDRFNRFNIKTRSRSEQQFARMAITTFKDRQHLTKKANSIARTRKQTFEEISKRAIKSESTLIRASHYEIALHNMLIERGIKPIPQKAIGTYNCDFAINSIAVEVWGGGWHWHGEHIAKTDKRFRYIMNAGYNIIVIAIDNRRKPLTAAIADYLVSEIQRLSSNPPPICEYRVIWGAGEFTVSGCLNDNHISVEPPFTNARNPTTGKYERISR